MKNFEVARRFYEMATLLEINSESVFRIRAYQRAARTIEALGEDIEAVAARGGLTALPGVGKELAVRIEEYLATGAIEQLDRLRGGLAPSFVDLLDVRGLGPKTARLLHDRLGVETIDRLEEVCRSKEILGVGGIGEKTRANILKGIALWRTRRTRTPLATARGIASQIVQALRARAGVDRIEIAGSLRRMQDSVKDIDILATSTAPERVIETFVGLPSVGEVVARGDTKATVRHRDGLPVDLRVVEPEAFGAALQYFTGSKAHNVRLRERASRRGLRVSEYGVFEDGSGRKIAGWTEADVYEAVGLPWIPPELREDGGEIEAAAKGCLPQLVTRADIRGDLHAHTDWSDGHHPIERLVEAAQARGYEYVIVSDHSQSSTIAGGLTADRVRAQMAEIRAMQPRYRIRILTGSECDILGDGTLDFPDALLAELDVVLGAVHSRFGQGKDDMTARILRGLANPHVDILAHPTGRRLATREPYDVDLEAVLTAAARHGKAVEINCSPERLDLKDTHARRAAELGVPIAISTDTHYLANLDALDLGLAIGRRAWLGPSQVLNTRPLEALLTWTRRAG